jgi:hypothetical protein
MIRLVRSVAFSAAFAFAGTGAAIALDPASKMLLADDHLHGHGVGLLTMTVINDNDFAVKDFEIRCSTSGESGTQLSTLHQVIFSTIKAKSRRTFKDFNMGLMHSQTARYKCWVETAKPQ